MKAKNQDMSDRKEQKSLDNLIRQTIGKESRLSFPRSAENPAQLIHLLHAFEQQSGNKFSKASTFDLGMDSKDFTQDQNGIATPFLTESSTVREPLHSNLKETRSFGNSQQNPTEQMSSLKFPEAVVAIAQAAAKVNGEPEKYLPGWPLLSKVQMLKCEKCSREFISPLNHRRHIRVHRRLLNLEKGDSQKKRADLAEFWDKLSVDEARQILSLKNIMLEEVSGSSIIKDMTSFIRKPGRLSLPQFYVKAGAALLDVAQMKSSRFPLSAADLFSILDDASEKTFLSAGTALSVQKFVFAGEAGKVILEVRNLVASMGFLVEQKLVKAWLVDKDAEALRCQKLLVEEEEAAEKKRAEQLERKRIKKLRQKELKEKEQTVNVEIVDTATSSPEVDGGGSLTAISSYSSTFSEDASPRQIPGATCADYCKDATVARENDIMSNTDNIGPPDMDLESRTSLDSVTGVPVDPELDYTNQQGKLQDKACTNVNFVRSGRDRKSSMETDLVLSQKYVSGSKNQQTFLKRTKKSSNASSSWQVSSNGALISDSVSGQRFGCSNKPLVQRTSSGGNVYRIWTKKTRQMSMANINIGLKTEDRPKDGADDACEMKLVDSLEFSSDFTDSGITCKSTLMTVQEDIGIMAVETSTKSDVNDALKTPVVNDDSVTTTSHWTNPEVTGGELLIGSMSLCLDSFPNRVSKPRQAYSKDILLDESNCCVDGKDGDSISNCFDSSTECMSASNTVGPSHLRVIDNSSAKSHRSYSDSLSDKDSLGHPPKQSGQGMFVKQELRQDGASKPGTKIWRPISHATDCRGEEGITDCTMNSIQIEDFMIDSQGRAAINATAHFPLKPENTRHLICTQNGDSCFTNSESEQKIDTDQNEKQFGETVDRTLRNENKLQLFNGTKEGNEWFRRKENEIVETIDQRETNFELACDAAAAFLSQRWEAAVISSEAEVLECLDSGAVEGIFSVVSVVGSETGHFVSRTVSETNYLPGATFQSKDGRDGPIEAVQGRKKSFDCDFGTLPGESSSSHHTQAVEILEIGSEGDFRKPSALKPEIEHQKYMPRQRNKKYDETDFV